jgi:hypothetical protein
MALSPELVGFVKESLDKRLPRAEVERALLAAGWPADQVRQALWSFADVDFPIPVPRPVARMAAREAFLYVLMFGSLVLSSYQLGDLAFELINRAFPDPADPGDPRSTLQAIRWALSTLIVTFPLFLYVAWIVSSDIRRAPIRRASRIRRQLTFVTLFLAAVALVGDVIAVVYNFLGGELTTRLMLKVLVVAIIAGSVFAYYLLELRADEREPET